MKNAYHSMFVPIFWDLFKNDYVISVSHFQTKARKALHVRFGHGDVCDFFKEMEKVGYGKFMFHETSTGMPTKAFKCIVKPSKVESTVDAIIECGRMRKRNEP
jgi:hypothetical protein